MQRARRLESLVRFVDHVDLADDPEAQRLMVAATVTESMYQRRQIRRALVVKAIQQQRQPFNSGPPNITPVQDRIMLGTALTGSTYTIKEDGLTQHLLAIRRSGAGKTTVFYNLMDQLSVPYWVFDLKQDYHLLGSNLQLSGDRYA